MTQYIDDFFLSAKTIRKYAGKPIGEIVSMYNVNEEVAEFLSKNVKCKCSTKTGEISPVNHFAYNNAARDWIFFNNDEINYDRFKYFFDFGFVPTEMGHVIYISCLKIKDNNCIFFRLGGGSDGFATYANITNYKNFVPDEEHLNSLQQALVCVKNRALCVNLVVN